jgi:phosphatidylethanolamine N-methyltransferase
MTAKRLVGKLKNGSKFELPLLRDPFEFSLQLTGASDVVKALCLLNLLLLLAPLPVEFFLVWFALWRVAYNVGLGVMLRGQSNQHSFTKLYQRLRVSNGVLFRWAQRAILSEVSPDDRARCLALPDEAASWLLFRQLTDVVLNMDVVTFGVLGLKLAQWPALAAIGTDELLVCGAGALLFAIAMWGKRGAYDVIGAFAWYWGDFFFLCDQDLNFSNGVYAYFPHPMYTVGYLWMYGIALMAQSMPVLYATLFAHALQFLFLVLIENPHIDKTYNVEQAKESAKIERAEQRKEMLNKFKNRLNTTEQQLKQKAQAILRRN